MCRRRFRGVYVSVTVSNGFERFPAGPREMTRRKFYRFSFSARTSSYTIVRVSDVCPVKRRNVSASDSNPSSVG